MAADMGYSASYLVRKLSWWLWRFERQTCRNERPDSFRSTRLRFRLRLYPCVELGELVGRNANRHRSCIDRWASPRISDVRN